MGNAVSISLLWIFKNFEKNVSKTLFKFFGVENLFLKLNFSAAFISNQRVKSDEYRQLGSAGCSQTMLSPDSVQLTRKFLFDSKITVLLKS